MNLYTCTGCTGKYLMDNTQCTACGQDFCPDCSTWWNSGFEYCYSCRVEDSELSPMRGVRVPFTRYFKFVKLGVSQGDLEGLMETCVRIDACLAFKQLEGKVVSGIIILRGQRAYLCNLQLCFPGFELSVIQTQEFIDDGNLIFTNGDLPYGSVRRRLFDDGVSNEIYAKTLGCMGAPDDWKGTVDDWMFYEGKDESQECKCQAWAVSLNFERS